jgi:predicted enzyme related to lactoylglutathione lyase
VLLLCHASAVHAEAIASPVTPSPTDTKLPGKLIWVDLVTSDPDKAVAFYSEVFGWSVQRQDEGYAELSQAGRTIGAVVAFNDDAAGAMDARWLVSISVEDADLAAARAVDAGAELLEPVEDFADRGRFALIRDAQGAMLMLLDASGGDPVEETVELNDWGWAELWTDDVAGAVSFYRAVAAYDALDAFAANGDKRVILASGGIARATVVPMPWPDVEPNWLPYVVVADTVATLRRIDQAGGRILATQPELAESARIAIVMDPTGGVFAVQQVEAIR